MQNAGDAKSVRLRRSNVRVAILVIAASRNRKSWGFKVLQVYESQGYRVNGDNRTNTGQNGEKVAIRHSFRPPPTA